MFKKLLLLSGSLTLCVTAMDPKPELSKKANQVDQQKITVCRSLTGARARVGYKITTDATTTIKELSEEMYEAQFNDCVTLPTIYAIYKTWWPTLHGWKPGWAEKRSEALDGSLIVHAVIKQYNTTVFQAI
jgi:hypothetical protein